MRRIEGVVCVVLAGTWLLGQATPDDFALRIVPATSSIVGMSEGLSTGSAEFAVTVDSTVDGVSAWRFSVMVVPAPGAAMRIASMRIPADVLTAKGGAAADFLSFGYYNSDELDAPIFSAPVDGSTISGLDAVGFTMILIVDFMGEYTFSAMTDFETAAFTVSASGQADSVPVEAGRVVFTDDLGSSILTMVACDGRAYYPSVRDPAQIVITPPPFYLHLAAGEGSTSTTIHVAEHSPAHVFVSLTNPQPVQAFSLGIAHDRAVAALTAIDLADCPVMQALNGGGGPDYFGADLDPGTSNCSEETAGGTLCCIASQSAPSTATIPVGTRQPIAHLTYEAVPGSAAGTESPLAIVGCLGGDAPRDVVLAVEGISITPIVVGGTLVVDQGAYRFTRGDANRDGRADLSDVVTLLMYLFDDGRGLLRCEDAGDANDDGLLDIADPIRVLGYLFAQGAPFDPPYPACGTDRTVDRLLCSQDECQ